MVCNTQNKTEQNYSEIYLRSTLVVVIVKASVMSTEGSTQYYQDMFIRKVVRIRVRRETKE